MQNSGHKIAATLSPQDLEYILRDEKRLEALKNTNPKEFERVMKPTHKLRRALEHMRKVARK